MLSNEVSISEEKAENLIQLNPDFWEAWYLAGQIYYKNKDYKNAIIHFKQAKKREVTTIPDIEMIEKMIKKSYRKL